MHRLIRHISLIDCRGFEFDASYTEQELENKGAKIYKFAVGGAEDLGTRVSSFLSLLCDLFDEPASEKIRALVKERFEGKKLSSNDIPEELKDLFEKADVSSSVCHILKCVNQSIVAPCVGQVRYFFKDEKQDLLIMSRISWIIRVYVLSADEVIVVHNNHECCRTEPPFEVQWSLKLSMKRIDDVLKLEKVGCALTDYNVSNIEDPYQKGIITRTLKTMFKDAGDK